MAAISRACYLLIPLVISMGLTLTRKALPESWVQLPPDDESRLCPKILVVQPLLGRPFLQKAATEQINVYSALRRDNL